MIPVGVLASGRTTATPTVTGAWESSWHVRDIVPAATQASTWRVLGEVPKSAASAWKVYAAVIATKDAAWDACETVTTSATVAWNVNSIGTVTATKVATWHVRATVPQSVTSTWNVWISAGEKAVNSAWHVLYPVVAAVDCGWAVDAQVTATKAAAWNLDADTTTVTATEAATWNVKELLAPATQSIGWDVLTTTPPATKSSAWSIAQVTGSVTNSVATVWQVLETSQQTFMSSWNVLTEATSGPVVQSVTYLGYTARNPWPVVGPTTVDEGDLLLVYLLDDTSQTVMFGSGTLAPTPPAGWTEVLPNVERSAADDVSAFVFWRVATADDVATGTAKTYSWSWGTYLAVGAYAVVRVTGTHASAPVANVSFVASAAGATSSTIAAVTTASANSLLLLITGVDESNTALDPYWAEPLATGYTSLLGTSASPSGLGKGSVYTGIGYRNQEASGSSGDVTASIRAENDAIVGYLLSISPAVGSTTAPVTATQTSSWRVQYEVNAWAPSGWAVESTLITVSATRSSAWSITSEGVTYTATLGDTVGALDLDADQAIIFSATQPDAVGISDELSKTLTANHVTKSILLAWNVLVPIAAPKMQASAWHVLANMTDTYYTIVESSDIQVTLAAAVYTANRATSDLAVTLNPDLVIAAGDNAGDGTTAQYADATYGWAQHWGRAALWDKVRTVPGNHDWTPGNLTAYDAFFGTLRGGPAAGHWRSFDTTNGWHIALLDVNVANAVGSAQYNWLAADLTANSTKPTILVWHQPTFSNGPHGDSVKGADVWTLCYTSHPQVELILNGHDHCYQRFVRMDDNRAADSVRGIAQMGAAMGGGTDDIPTAGATLAARSTAVTQLGVLMLRLYSDRYYWEFVPTASSTPALVDSGTQYVRVPLDYGSSAVEATVTSGWKVGAQVIAYKASSWHVFTNSPTAFEYAGWNVLATISPATKAAAWDVLTSISPATSSSAWSVSTGSATSNPSFVKAAYDAGTGAVLTESVTFASAPTSGNLLVVAIGWDKVSGGFSLDSGTWNTLINNSSTSTSLAVFWKVSDGTETTITWTAGSVDLGGQVWAGEYTDTGNPSGTWSVVGSATNPTSEASVSTWSSGTTGATTAAGTALAFFSVDSHGTVDPTLSDSFTERYDGWATGLGRGGLMVGELTGVAASSTVSTTITRTADQQSGAVVVFAKT